MRGALAVDWQEHAVLGLLAGVGGLGVVEIEWS